MERSEYMYLSVEEIEKIVKDINIKDVIGKYINLQPFDNFLIGQCPFHKEISQSFIVNEKKQIYYCCGCGRGGNVINFLMDYFHISFLEALQKLHKVDLDLVDKLEDKKRKIFELNDKIANFFIDQMGTHNNAIQYIKKRNLNSDTIQKFKIGYAGEKKDELYNYLKKLGYVDEEIKETEVFGYYDTGITNKFLNRLMFPIQNVSGKIIGFGGRILKEEAKGKNKRIPKYLNSAETLIFDKSSNLFGMNFAIESKEDFFILCEGYMDVISMHQAGFTNAVASLGTALTQNQVALIKQYKDKVLIAYDSDGPGITAIKRAIPILQEFGIGIKIIDMSPYKDPDEFIKNLGREEYKNRVDEALDVQHWAFNQALKNDDISLIHEFF